jgi:hypothetical protein
MPNTFLSSVAGDEPKKTSGNKFLQAASAEQHFYSPTVETAVEEVAVPAPIQPSESRSIFQKYNDWSKNTGKGIANFFFGGVKTEEELNVTNVPGPLPEKTFTTAFREIKDQPAKVLPFLQGGNEAAHAIELYNAGKRLEDDTASARDVALMRDYIKRSQQDTSWGYDVANLVTQSIPFAVELGLTGGIYTAGRKAAMEGAETVLKKFLTKEGQALLEKRAAKFALKAAGVTAGATAQTAPAMFVNIGASTVEKMTPIYNFTEDEAGKVTAIIERPGQDFGEALRKSFGEAWVETVSERTGGVLTGLGSKVQDTAFKSAFVKAFFNTNTGPVGTKLKVLNTMLQRIGWNGVAGEMFEERVGDVMHGALKELGLSDQEWKWPTAEQLSTELVGFAIPGTAFAGTAALLNKGKQMKWEKDTEKVITESGLADDINNALSVYTEEDVKRSIVDQTGVTAEHAQSIMDIAKGVKPADASGILNADDVAAEVEDIAKAVEIESRLQSQNSQALADQMKQMQESIEIAVGSEKKYLQKELEAIKTELAKRTDEVAKKVTELEQQVTQKPEKKMKKTIPGPKIEKGAQVIVTAKHGDRSEQVEVVSQREDGIIAKEPVSGLPMLYRNDRFDVAPVEKTQKELEAIKTELAKRTDEKEQEKEITKIAQAISAKVLGTKAFERGVIRAPAQDQEFMKQMEGKSHKEMMASMKEWTAAWDEANLAAPVDYNKPPVMWSTDFGKFWGESIEEAYAKGGFVELQKAHDQAYEVAQRHETQKIYDNAVGAMQEIAEFDPNKKPEEKKGKKAKKTDTTMVFPDRFVNESAYAAETNEHAPVRKDFYKGIKKYMTAVREQMGYEPDTDKKGKDISVTYNPGGQIDAGAVTSIFWKPGTNIGIYVQVQGQWGKDETEVIAGDKYGMGTLVRATTKEDKYKGLANDWVKMDGLTVEQLAEKLTKIVDQGERTLSNSAAYESRKAPDIAGEEPAADTAVAQQSEVSESEKDGGAAPFGDRAGHTGDREIAPEVFENKQGDIAPEQKNKLAKVIMQIAEANNFDLNANVGESLLSVENPPWMDLSIERQSNKVFISHIGIQNGDVMRDPEIVLEIVDGQMVPKTFTNDYARIKDMPIRPNDELIDVWSQNLLDQGFTRGKIETNEQETDERRDIPPDNAGSVPDALDVPAGDDRAADTGTHELGTGELADRVDELGAGLSAERTDVIVEKVGKKGRQSINDQVKALLEERGYSTNREDYTEDEIGLLKLYSGAGGKESAGAEGKGLLSEFYTPNKVVQKTWELALQYAGTVETAFEPSAGTGRYIMLKPDGVSMDGIELDLVSGTVAQIINPESSIEIGDFQNIFFQKEERPQYDLVIGNPPYGARGGFIKGKGEEEKIDRWEEYFIKRGLDLVKEGGTVAYVVNSSFLQKQTSKGKEAIVKLGTLEAAYRLPEGTFEDTSIGTDIVIFRKDTTDSVAGHGARMTLITGDRYFEHNTQNILGETKTRKNRFGKEETYVTGDLSALDKIVVENKAPDEVKQSPKEDPKPAKKKSAKAKTTKKKGTRKNSLSQIYEPISGKKTKNRVISATNRQYTKAELDMWANTANDGSIKGFISNEDQQKYNFAGGKWYSNTIYYSGNIVKRLAQLEEDKVQMPKEQYERQKMMLLAIKPPEVSINDISFDPQDRHILNVKVGDSTVLRSFLHYLHRNKPALPNGVYESDIDRVMMGSNARQGTKQIMPQIRDSAKRLFNLYIKERLPEDVQKEIVDNYNETKNNTVNTRYEDIPVQIDGMSDTFKGGKPLELSPTQKRGVAFLVQKRTGVLAWGVGVGKTLGIATATVANMQAGNTKRPLIIVPKSTIEQTWVETFRLAFPNIGLVNLSGFTADVQRKMYAERGEPKDWIKDGEVTFISHEGLLRLGFAQKEIEELTQDLNDALWQEVKTKRGEEEGQGKIQEIMGAALKYAGDINFSDLGFDHISVDEVHNHRKVFQGAKTEKDEAGNNVGKKRFATVIGGTPSKRAVHLFLTSQYIQKKYGGNVFLASATPFENHATEVYNILSFIARPKLIEMGIQNINDFYAMFANFVPSEEMDQKGNVVTKDVMKSWKNLPALQALLREYIDRREDPTLIRPERRVMTPILSMSELQEENNARIQAMLKGEESPDADQIEANPEMEGLVSANDLRPGAYLVAMGYALANSVSPYFVEEFAPTTFTKEELVENSPKIKYSMELIKKLKADKKTKNYGTFLYFGAHGVQYHGMIKDYIVEHLGYKESEVGIINGETDNDEREDIKESFNKGEIKILIGGKPTREGIDLQGSGYTTINLSLGWNPTETQQVEGRVWRQGNKRNIAPIVYPLVENSGDVVLYQKYEQKGGRINDLFSYVGETFDTDELDPQEKKLALITDPKAKATLEIAFDNARMANERVGILTEQRNLETLRSEMEIEERSIKRYEASLKDTEAYGYDRYAPEWKKELAKSKAKVKRMKESLERKRITDIDAEIKKLVLAVEDIEARIRDLNSTFGERLERFTAERMEEIRNRKSIQDHLDDFFANTTDLKEYTQDEIDAQKRAKEEEVKRKQAEGQIPQFKIKDGSLSSSIAKAKASGQSFEEWVKWQGETLYHGTGEGVSFEKFDVGKAQFGNRGKQIYLTENRVAADWFSRIRSQANFMQTDEFKYGTDSGALGKFKPNTLEFVVPKGAKIKVLNKLPQYNAESVINKLKEEGYDGVRFTDDVLNNIEGQIGLEKAFVNGKHPDTTIIFNPDILKTRAQLKAEWDAVDTRQFMRRDELGRFAPEDRIQLIGPERLAELNEQQQENYRKHIEPQLTSIPFLQEGEEYIYFSGHNGAAGQYVDLDLERQLDRGHLDTIHVLAVPTSMLKSTGSKAKDAVGERLLTQQVSFKTLDEVEAWLERKIASRMISKEQTLETLQQFKDRLGIDFNVHFFDKILTGEKAPALFSLDGRTSDVDAWGVTVSGAMAFTEKTLDVTPAHEVVHFVLNNLDQLPEFGVTKAELNALADDETIARGFETFWKTGKSGDVANKLAEFFKKLATMIREILGMDVTKAQALQRFYYDVMYMRRFGPTVRQRPQNLARYTYVGEHGLTLDFSGFRGLAEAGYQRKTVPEDLVGEMDLFKKDLTRKDINLLNDITAQARDIYLKDQDEFKGADIYQTVADTRRIKKASIDRRFADMLSPYFDLPSEEKKVLNVALSEGDRQVRKWNKNELATFGVTSAKAIGAYYKTREAFEYAHDMLIAKMEENGVKEDEINQFRKIRVGYIPHRWDGRYVIKSQEMDEGGRWKTVSMQDYKTESQARKAYAELESTDNTRFVLDTLDSVDVDFFTAQHLTAENVISAINRSKVPEEFRQEVVQGIRDMSKEKGFGRYYIRRMNIAGYETENLDKIFADYFSGLAGYVTKMEAAPMYFKALQTIDPRRQKKFYKWMRDAIAYDMGNTAELNTVKQAAFIWMLANDISYLMVNATQNMTVGTGELSKYMKGARKIAGAEAALTKAMLSWWTGNITKEERGAVEFLLKNGRLGGEMTSELMGFKSNPIYRTISNTLTKALYSSTAFVESHVNRVPAFIAARRVLIANGADPATVDRQALSISDDIHFRYGKQNRPRMERGRAGALFVFTHWTRSFLYQLSRDLSQREFMAFGKKMFYTAVLGGALSLPFAKLWLRIYNEIVGDDDDELKKELSTWELALARGIPAVFGADLSGRVSIDIFQFDSILSDPTNIVKWGGAGASMIDRFSRGYDLAMQERYYEAAAKLVPDGLGGNFFKAYAGYTYGVRSQVGKLLERSPGVPMKYTPWEAALRGIGFTPTEENLAWARRGKVLDQEAKKSERASIIRRKIETRILAGDVAGARNLEEEARQEGKIGETSTPVEDYIETPALMKYAARAHAGESVLLMKKQFMDEVYPGEKLTPQKKAAIDKKFDSYAAFGPDNELVTALLGGKTNENRVKILIEARSEMGPEEFSVFLAKARKTKLVSEELLKLYRRQQIQSQIK